MMGTGQTEMLGGTITWLERRRHRFAIPSSPDSLIGLSGRDDFQGLKVLIADDDPDSTSGLARLLRLRSATVFTAYDGDLAFQIARNERPHVIFLDISMPQPDGWEICRRIRAAAWGINVPIVAVTGLGSKGQMLKCSEVGFDYHVLKPVTFEVIEQLIDQALN